MMELTEVIGVKGMMQADTTLLKGVMAKYEVLEEVH